MRRNQIMDHTAVVRQKMTERYLLDELDSEVRDEFEEHYFDCPECALDIRAGAQFVAHTKTVLAQSAEPVLARATPGQSRARGGWFAWLRPAFAAPVLALLLAMIGYQNLVTYPRLQSDLKQPQVLPSASVNLGTWGAGGPPVVRAHPPGRRLCALYRRLVSSRRKAGKLVHNRAYSRSRSVVGDYPEDSSGSRNLHDGGTRRHRRRGGQRPREYFVRITNSEMSSERGRGTLWRL